METEKNFISYSVLQDFSPLNALSEAHLNELSQKAVVEEIQPGKYVFRQGERDNQTVYLLDGKVELLDASQKIAGRMSARCEQAKHPLAHRQPRQLSVRAIDKVSVVKIDSDALDVLLAWDQDGNNVEGIETGESDDWLTRFLQSETVSRLPPANIQQLLKRMEAVPMTAGEVVVEEGDKGDYFYVVQSGRLSITREGAVDDKHVLLAELTAGGCFGEEALVAGTQRNATVTMSTDGVLRRLPKQDFDVLLRDELVQRVDLQAATELIASGAEWLDVRLPEEFANYALPASRNIPLAEIRSRLSELDQSKKYITCCDTGRRSASAAFVLGQQGFDAVVLYNGLMDVPLEQLTSAALEQPEETPDLPVNQQVQSPDVGASVAESAAQAAVISGYLQQIEKLREENDRVLAETKQTKQLLEAQNLKMEESAAENAASLETARAAMARTQAEQQNVLKEQARLKTLSRELESDNERLHADHEAELYRLQKELERVGDLNPALASEREAQLQQQLSEAAAQAEQQKNAITQLEVEHEQVLLEQENQLQLFEAEVQNARKSLQQKTSQLSQLGEQYKKKQTALETENTQLREALAKAKQVTGTQDVSLDERFKQLKVERDKALQSVHEVQQEADQLRAEAEVIRGLEAMEKSEPPAAGVSEEDYNDVKIQLENYKIQDEQSTKRVTQLEAELSELQVAQEVTPDTSVNVQPVINVPLLDDDEYIASDVDDVTIHALAEQHAVPATVLVEEDEGIPTVLLGNKWMIGLAAGAIIGAGVLYFLPDFSAPATDEVELTPAPVVVEEASENMTAVVNSIRVAVEDAIQSNDKIIESSLPEDISGKESIESLEATLQAQTDVAGQEVTGIQFAPPPKMKPGRILLDNLADGGQGPHLIQLPAGHLVMGSTVTSPYFDERPQHEVSLAAFAMGMYEVTHEEYGRFAQATGRHLPPDEGWGRGRRPVINVSWDDAVEYTRWLSDQTGARYRLPTEAEWEYGTRAGTITHYWWGNDSASGLFASCFNCGSEWDGTKTAPVGSFSANPVGLQDVTGNVMEWTQDCYQLDYRGAPSDGSAVDASPCDARVVRGGSYTSALESLRSASRAKRVPQSRLDNLGFRVVRD